VGGLAFVVGNVIEQSSTTNNETIISYGAEGYRWPVNELYVVHNTLVDDLPQGGRVLSLRPGAARVDLVDNLVIGNRLQAAGVPGRFAGNYMAPPREIANAAQGDYRLRAGARAVGRAVEAGSAHGRTLRAVREYVHPRASRAIAAARNPGALQETAR
jgi:hypothetical protein